jgi:hypothetical protein
LARAKCERVDISALDIRGSTVAGHGAPFDGV